jgi:hypothetical protein
MGHIDNPHDTKYESESQAEKGIVNPLQHTGQDGLDDCRRGDQFSLPIGLEPLSR